MRDDIHKRLPLPRKWQRLVRYLAGIPNVARGPSTRGRLRRAPRHREESYCTRTFTYVTLAALIWWKNSARRIMIGESGLGPALVPVGIEQPVRGSHPDFTEALSELLGQLWGTPPPFSFPHLWHTKAMVLAELRGFASLEGWVHTRSCNRNIGRQHPDSRGSHCGLWDENLGFPHGSWVRDLTFRGAA